MSEEEASAVRVQLDGETIELAPGSTLAELLARRGVSPEAVATAVNGDFVARAARAARTLSTGDSVMCFKPITGG
jgi:sulfur carrier protein